MPLSDAQKQALADFAGLRLEDGHYRPATDSELVSTPSPLVEWKTARIRRLQSTAGFLRATNRSSTTAAGYALRRSADAVLTRLDETVGD